MHGFIRAIARFLVMGAAMGAGLVGSLLAGLGLTAAIAIGIVLAGAVGLVGVLRRPRVARSGVEEIEAMLAADPLERKPAAAPPPVPQVMSVTATTRVESMAPNSGQDEDPEAGMPRWRRPSLLEARRSDPSRSEVARRAPLRFADGGTGSEEVRVVRYAVVPVLDRPDEVLGLRLSDLGAGDEVRVVGSSGAFLEVVCTNGDQGFVHRTTLAPAPATGVAESPRQPMPQEADDALSALLAARGLA